MKNSCLVSYLEQASILNSLKVLHVARPRFYAIDDLENQGTESGNDSNSSSQAGNGNREHITCHQRDRQQRIEAKNSAEFHGNVAVVANRPTDKPAMGESLEEMRRLLTSIRRRVSVQYSGNSVH